MEAEPELLEPVLWHVPWRYVVAVVLVLVAATLAWQADQRERKSEAASLEECRVLLRDATVAADLQHGSVAASGVARQYVLAGDRSRPAQLLLPDAVHADDVCRAVSVKPWHRSLERQRDAATAYSGRLVAELGANVTAPS